MMILTITLLCPPQLIRCAMSKDSEMRFSQAWSAIFVMRKCCAPAERCGTAQDRAEGTVNNPKEKTIINTPITKYTRYIAGWAH